jgi:hypothetical protein
MFTAGPGVLNGLSAVSSSHMQQSALRGWMGMWCSGMCVGISPAQGASQAITHSFDWSHKRHALPEHAGPTDHTNHAAWRLMALVEVQHG